MNAEDYFISLFSNRAAVIGDDGALLGGMVYSKDAFFENIHFSRRWMTPEQIGYKAMMVNISDAIAMNARPKYALLAVAIPPEFSRHQMRALHRGFQRAADEQRVDIIGGDTISNVKLDITITIISQTSRALLRKGLKKGDLLAYTGKLGRSQKELRYLLSGGKIHQHSKFVTFSLRRDFVRECSGFLSCGMDISDGLFSDLQKLAVINRVGYRFFRTIPKEIGCSGEEYEMLIGFNPCHRKRIVRIAAKNRTPLTIFAKAQRKRFASRCKAHHFN